MANTEQPFQLFKFANCSNLSSSLEFLVDYTKGTKDTWEYQNTSCDRPYPILYNYIQYTFNRLMEEYNTLSETEKSKKILITDAHACFNTGLYTCKYEPIYGFFYPNKIVDRQKWYLYGFLKESHYALQAIPSLPERADYFMNPAALIYNYKLDIRTQFDHILDDEDNFNRIPAQIREKYDKPIIEALFKSAVDETKKKLAANYKIAIPQYYNHEVQLLIPIDLEKKGTPDLALALSPQDNHYSGRTCLSLDMAYNNARLIVKPESDWLNP